MENTAEIELDLIGDIAQTDSHTAVASSDSCEFNLIARKLVALTGSIFHKGQPLEGVIVDAGELGSAITDASGSFQLKTVVEGTAFEVEISKESFLFDGDTFAGTVEDGEEILFHATELFTISGTIVHKGESLAGVEVDGGALGTTTTYGDGRYEFTDVAEGTEFSITAIKDGYVFEIA